MGLRFVYGRAGSGKSTFCFEEIREKIEKQQKVYVITPEQFSFTAEQKLMEISPTKAILNAEVITFDRMAYRVLNEVGGITEKGLTKSGKAILLYSILHKQKKQLRFLGKTQQNVDLIASSLTELKKHGITWQDLKQQQETIQDPYLKIKLQDLRVVYENYERSIAQHLIDETDRLDILAEKLQETDMFENTYLYFDEFARIYVSRI